MLLAMGMLAGCSPVEKDYYNLLMEANNQKVYEDSGSIELTLDNFAFADSTETANIQLVKKLLDQYRLDYTNKVDYNQNVLQSDYVIVDKNTGLKSPFLSMVYKNNVLYIKVDDMVNFLKKLGDAELNKGLDQIFGDAEYVTITDQELKSIMPPNTMNGGLFANSQQVLSVYTRLLDGLINQVYDNYQSNMITKSNNTYTLTLRTANAIDTIKPMAIYTINNSDKLAVFLKAFLNGMSSQELAYLSLTPEMRAQAIAGIDKMALDINQKRSLYLNQLNNIPASAQDGITKYLNDSYITASIQKNNQAYNTSVKMHFLFTPSATEKLGFTLNAKDTLQPCKSVQVAAPTGKTISFKSLEKWLPVTMNIKLDNGAYFVNKGFRFNSGNMDVQIVNNYTYLPLRTIGEALGENVNWDQTLGQAYVEQNGQRIVMTGINRNNHIYVKCRDFEKLGFTVNWNASARTVTITK
jgi:hypothetical protein